mgnify:CR=1 FL=1
MLDIRFKDAAAQNDQELTVKAITLMEEHMGEEKVMDLVCKKIGLSRKSLDRNLKTTLDLTGKELLEKKPHAWVKWGVIAACLCIVIAGFFVIRQRAAALQKICREQQKQQRMKKQVR